MTRALKLLFSGLFVVDLVLLAVYFYYSRRAGVSFPGLFTQSSPEPQMSAPENSDISPRGSAMVAGSFVKVDGGKIFIVVEGREGDAQGEFFIDSSVLYNCSFNAEIGETVSGANISGPYATISSDSLNHKLKIGDSVLLTGTGSVEGPFVVAEVISSKCADRF
ncbi:MAG: hypothetical protein ACOYT7_00335 [Patescibacteria group bacterium]